MKKRIICYVRVALRIASVMIACGFFVLFFGVLAVIGASHHSGRGYYQAFMNLVFMFEDIIVLVVFVATLVLVYGYAVIEVSVNAIAKKLKLMIQFLVHPIQQIKSRKKDNDGENTQKKEEQQKVAQAEKGFFSKVWARYNDLAASICLHFESMFQEIREKQTKLNNVNVEKESEDKGTNELSVDTVETADAPVPPNPQEEKEAQIKKVEKEKIE